MKKLTFPTLLLGLLLGGTLSVNAESYKFDLTGAKTPKDGYTAISTSNVYSKDAGYGYDFTEIGGTNPDKPFFFSVDVPDGNYKVTVTLGNDKDASNTTIKGEARRLYANNVETKKGENKEVTFIVNKRDVNIKGKKDKVKIKDREKTGKNWDDKLTLEFTGHNPHVKYIAIEPVEKVTTVYICGDSTVTDNDAEPYSGWAQMLPLMFDENVSIANYAESGLSANTFLGQKRLEKAVSQMKKGDYVLIEFGHNDQKQKDPGAGAYYNYAYSLKQYIDYAKQKGATPILITPTRRRQFDKDGKTIKDTHADYPQAMKEIAEREGVLLVDFQELTKILYETMGEEDSKKLLVHYPMGTFPGQEKELKDNTHFSNFGAYEIAKIFVADLANQNIPLAQYVKPEYRGFNPSKPDKFESFDYTITPLYNVGKPAGN